MGPIVFGISFIVFVVGIVMLVVNLFRKKSKKMARFLLVFGFLLFVFSLFLPGPSGENTSTDQTVEGNKGTNNEDDQTEIQDEEVEIHENDDEKENEEENEEEQTNNETVERKQPEADSQQSDDGGNSESKDQPENSPPNDSSVEDTLFETATVTRVVDGDTIEIKLNGKIEDVRLLLVDTPETVHPSLPVQPYGPEASAFAKEKLNGKQVQVEFDGPKRDKYDRLLAYLWVDGKMFNQMLLEEGLARLAYVYDPPYTHYDAYVRAQTKAVNAKRGIWSMDGYVTEEGFVTESTSNSQEGNSSQNASGEDKDCGDFKTHKEAQTFFENAGGPDKDPHRLDADGNGLACESLP